MAVRVSKPVLFLRDHLKALEAALPVCLADPKRKPVHALRAEIRYAEAQIALLSGVKGLPPFRTEAAALLEATAELRRRTGKVRDLDVFRRLLADHVGEVAIEADNIRRVRDDCEKLDKLCHERRDKAAKRLLTLLRKQQTEVALAAESLLAALEPAFDMELPRAELLEMAEKHFAAHPELRLPSPLDEELHTIRKAAKIARYQAEGIVGEAAATGPVARYHGLQEAGGDWHDWLELTALAADELGHHRVTTMAFGMRCGRFKRVYLEKLAGFRSRA